VVSLSLGCSFVLQVLLFYARQFTPIPPIAVDAPACLLSPNIARNICPRHQSGCVMMAIDTRVSACRNFVVNLELFTYVGLSCAGYEYVRAYALDRMETALDEARRANMSLQQAIKVKERFLANVSHGTVRRYICARVRARAAGTTLTLHARGFGVQSCVRPCTAYCRR
jgi:hypothetical protein